mgnify:CR=1 FL=1
MDLISQAEEYITHLFQNALTPDVYTYHNLNHTKGVVESVKKMSKHENISYEDTEKLLLAAWFHDLGYIVSCQNHENHSVEEFKKWAQSKLDSKIILMANKSYTSSKGIPFVFIFLQMEEIDFVRALISKEYPSFVIASLIG